MVLNLFLALGGLLPFQHAASAPALAYLKGGEVWVTTNAATPPRRVPNSRGAALLAASPTSGTLAFLTGPKGADVNAAAVPPLTPRLSKSPYTASFPLSTLIRTGANAVQRARWLTWEGDGRTLIAGTDLGTVGWNLVSHQAFVPNQTPLYQTTSRDGEVTATLGSIQSAEDPGVLLYGPGARPGTEVFSRKLPQNLMTALRRDPLLKTFAAQLDPRAQAHDHHWVVTPPQVTRDGRQVYFAANAGWGVGSGGSTTFAVFQVQVADVTLRALGWLGTYAGSALNVLPSPDGQSLLLLQTTHISNAETPTVAYIADLKARSRLRLNALTPAPGRTTLLGGACWLADGRQVALSVAQPKPGELIRANRDTPPTSDFTLLVIDAHTGQVMRRIPGATQPACLPG